MQTDRRNFLKLVVAGAGGVLLHEAYAVKEAQAASSAEQNTTAKAALYDVTKCVGCRACQTACKRWNGMPADSTGFEGIYDNPFRLSSKTMTLIKYKEIEKDGAASNIFCKYQCMHCQHPACVEACIVGALTKLPGGPVIYDTGKCIGCRYCMVACPFGVPSFEWDKPMPWIRKCTFCADRQEQGREPACVAACPTGALMFGTREELLTEAKQRIASNPDKYIGHIYGEHEAGGTSWLYLSPVPFDELGFPLLDEMPVTVNTERAMAAVPPVLVGVAVAMTGVYAIARRRQKMGELKQGSKGTPGTKEERGG